MFAGLGKAIRLTSGIDVLQFALESWNTDPSVRIEDAYKWLFHATVGGEHALTNPEAPKAWLEREWPTLGAPSEGEQPITKLRRDGSLVRFNLRPYKASSGDKDKLLRAFIHSAKSFKANKEHFVEVWQMLGIRLQTGSVHLLNREDWVELEELTKPNNYPAIDHSPTHLQIAKPAYRVLTRDDAKQLLNR